MLQIEEACIQGNETMFLANSQIIIDTAQDYDLQRLFKLACKFSSSKKFITTSPQKNHNKNQD